MTILEARLNQMRSAAIRLRASGNRVDESVKTIHQLVDELLAMGVESPAALEFVARYRNQKGGMDDWGGVILTFARHLDNAADEVELAMLDPNRQITDLEISAAPPAEALPILPVSGAAVPVAYSGTLAMGRYWRRKRRSTPAEAGKAGLVAAAPVTAAAAIPYDGYLSKQNRPLYDDFVQKKDELHAGQTHLDELRQERAARIEELAALKNRLMSVDHTRDVNTIPRVQAMTRQIQGIELDIDKAVANIRRIDMDVARLSDRLMRVTPAPGADLKLVASMEFGQTLQIIKDNTQDCVKHIVTRMAIPPGLPTDAHLWNDNIARMPEYGISSGKLPLEGAVLVMERDHSYADDIYGHLMYVEKIENGQVWVTDNLHLEPVPLTDLTSETTGANISYLYFPWQTKG